jgi:tetratricopeptide (TPR) repeat protein
MPVNAERNFRRALELEDESKPSADYLAAVLQQTGRDHEVPGIWKAIVAKYPESAQAHVKYAMSLIQTGKAAEGEKVFESALETIEDNAIIKRYYAPYLAQAKQDFDRAMDFYEDALDTAPNDVPTLMEYAQTLEAAGREHEVPQVLKNILASEPEQDIRATTLARLIELEQPKRVESVENASAKMESGDFQGALRDLKPLRNWLADYWKLWALLASAYNRTEQYVDAEEASMRLLQLYPGCEPGYGEAVQALGGQGKHQEAYFLMRQAAGQLPQSLPVFLNLGLAAKRVGNTDEARALAKQIREALAQDPNRDQVEPILVEMES